MNAAQVHRGPDDSGLAKCKFPSGEVVLGNTRLAIIDTSPAGHQPMNDPETGNCITYNGEIYNFKELRRRLKTSHGFQTRIPKSFFARTESGVLMHFAGCAACLRLPSGTTRISNWCSLEIHSASSRYTTSSLKDRLLFASELRALLASRLLHADSARKALTRISLTDQSNLR